MSTDSQHFWSYHQTHHVSTSVDCLNLNDEAESRASHLVEGIEFETSLCIAADTSDNMSRMYEDPSSWEPESSDFDAKLWARSLRQKSRRSGKDYKWNAACLPCVETTAQIPRSILKNGHTAGNMKISPDDKSTKAQIEVTHNHPIHKSVVLTDCGKQHITDICVPISEVEQVKIYRRLDSARARLELHATMSHGEYKNDSARSELTHQTSYSKLTQFDDHLASSPLEDAHIGMTGEGHSEAQACASRALHAKSSFRRLSLPDPLDSGSALSLNTAGVTSSSDAGSASRSTAAISIMSSEKPCALDASAASDLASTEALLASEMKDAIVQVIDEYGDSLNMPVNAILDDTANTIECLPGYPEHQVDDIYHRVSVYQEKPMVEAPCGNIEGYVTGNMRQTLNASPYESNCVDLSYHQVARQGSWKPLVPLRSSHGQFKMPQPSTRHHKSLRVTSGSIVIGKAQITAGETVSPVAGSRGHRTFVPPFLNPISKLKTLSEHRSVQDSLPASATISSNNNSAKWFFSLRSPMRSIRKNKAPAYAASPFSESIISYAVSGSSLSSPTKTASSWFRSLTTRGRRAKEQKNQAETIAELSGLCMAEGPFVDVERDESFNRRWFDRFSNHVHKL